MPEIGNAHHHDQVKRHVRRWLRFAGLATVVGLLASTVSGCFKPAAVHPPKPPEVIVTQPITDKVTDFQDYTGRLMAVKTVNVRPRASGYIVSAPFKEGDRVKEGQVIFKVDKQSYQADFNQAEASLHLAEADEKLQEQLTSRSQRLVPGGGASPEELDQNVAALAKSRANVAAMRAARDKAKLNLSYCDVVSPVTGRISQRLVDPGNLVNADQTVLTTVVTEDPIYAVFDVDERTYLNLVEAANTSSWLFGLQFPALMGLANEADNHFSHKGTINFIDNQINSNAGTIRLRASFPNPGGLLRPGLFVRIRLPIGTPYETLLVPDEAVQSDQGRKFVFVTQPTDKKGDDGQPLYKVEYRRVEIGQAIKGLRVIKSGLKKGDNLVVVGMQMIKEGAEVTRKTQPPPARPESPLGSLFQEEGGNHPVRAGG
jgi:RND family efflux transporter MFP subunit